MEFCPLDNTIYFNLFSDTDQTIDFGELANMVFKQIGLVGWFNLVKIDGLC